MALILIEVKLKAFNFVVPPCPFFTVIVLESRVFAEKLVPYLGLLVAEPGASN